MHLTGHHQLRVNYNKQETHRVKYTYQIKQGISLCSSFSVLISPYLGLDCVPVDLYVPCVLLKLINILLFAILLKESLTICNNSVHVCLIIDSDVKCTLPPVQFDVHLDGTIE